MDFHWVIFDESNVPFMHVMQKSDSTLSIDAQLPAGGYIIAITGNSSIGTASSSIAISAQG